ncbi:MAG TPA: FAD-dependent oxidoreductase, partial [Corynebacterium urealyticum]|nr:FAD-dependent oxidoreductase [Corynebacterium urealyticum]
MSSTNAASTSTPTSTPTNTPTSPHTDPPTRTVIVGGVAGGMSAAARLRRRDETAEIIVLESSGHVSFANCGLPYYLGGVIEDRSSLLLQTPDSLRARFNLDVRVNTTATRIDRAAKTVHVQPEQGEPYELSYDHLVLSPGASPFVPPIPGIDRAYTLRNIENTDAITAALNTTP